MFRYRRCTPEISSSDDFLLLLQTRVYLRSNKSSNAFQRRRGAPARFHPVATDITLEFCQWRHFTTITFLLSIAFTKLRDRYERYIAMIISEQNATFC